MRFRHPDGSTVHLAYCTNVHAATDVDGVLDQLGRYAGPVRAALGVGRLGVGLWLSAPAAEELDVRPDRLAALRKGLAAHGLEVVTLNGFPYGDFHGAGSKHAVYTPDWTAPARAAHTLRLARLLAALLPDDVGSGSISTLPLAWRTPWDAERARAARDRLGEVADGLAALAARTGRSVRLAVEPEPGCVLETTGQVGDLLAGAGLGPHVGACLDAAHFAVQFEDPARDVAALAARTAVVKAQVSAALRVPDAADPAAREALAAFVEPRFLHQTRTRAGLAGDGAGGGAGGGAAGTVLAVDDLDVALEGGLPARGEWRSHVHVPLHADPEGTTATVLDAVLAGLVAGPHPLTTHLEVETYTWTVLPAPLRPADDPGLVAGIARELDWTRGRLAALGLQELP